MNGTLRQHSLTAILAVLALGAAACGRGDTGSAPQPAGGTPGPSASTSQTRPTPRDQVQEGGTFTWPLTGMPPNFNYNQLDGTLQDNAYVVSALLPTAYTNDAASTPMWNRNYLASEPKLTTDPKQVVTYQIHPKAVWYDGTPITWEDFYWQWKANNGTNKAYQISAANGYEEIESVQKGKDDREVIVTYKNKYADWTNVFSQFYPASTNKDPKVFNEGWRERPLTTAGPFKLDSINQTTKTITLVRNEKWWGAPAKLDRIVFRIIDHNAQIDALANGEIDAMDIGPDANTYNRARSLPNVEMRVAGGPNFRHITINGTSANLTDARVRQAIAMAIDRATIAKALLGPLGIAPTTLDNHLFMANQEGYQNTAGDIGKFNPGKARELLDQAGWRLEGTVRKKDGKPLEITFVIPAAVAASKQESELVQNMLAQVGVSVRINTVPSNVFFDKYLSPGQFDATVFSWMGTPYPISSSKSIYAKPTRNAKGEVAIQQNFARTGSDEIDALYNEANRELDRKKAIEIANRVDALIWQEVHSLTLYQRPELIACKKALVNFGAFGFATPWVYEDIGWAK